MISVIVPVYNVEEYLSECVESIRNQTYNNLEIILVDDGSTDNSANICDEYAKKDSRIKVIHKKNGGLADARNAGIKIATGKYIGFVDSDDFILPDMYEKLFNTIESTASDIVMAKWCYDDEIEKSDNSTENEPIVFTNCEALDFLIQGRKGQHISTSVWDRLYKREVIQEVWFPFGKCYEDIVWTTNVFWNAKRIAYIAQTVYIYRKREGSITQKDSIEKGVIPDRIINDRLYLLKEQVVFLKNIGLDKLASECNYRRYELMLVYLSFGCWNKKSNKQCFEINTLLNKEKEWALKYKKESIDIRRKIMLICGLYFRGLFSRFYGLWLINKYKNKKMD